MKKNMATLSISTTTTTTTTTATGIFSLLLLLVLTLSPTSCHSYRFPTTPKKNNDTGGAGGQESGGSDDDRGRGRDHDMIPQSDLNLLEFPLNLEYLEAEFFLWGSLGKGLDMIAPKLVGGGPAPKGAKMAKLDPFTKDVILQFAYQEVGHLKAIKKMVKGFPRPLLNLSAEAFGETMNSALGKKLKPSFNPYANSLNFLLASYLVPYVGLTGYVGANSKLKTAPAKRLVAGLLAVESGQDAVIRTLLYNRATEKVKPYGITVAEFTNKISHLRNKLGGSGVKDEGLLVKQSQGAEGKIKGNVLAGNKDSVGYDRSPKEILRIVYSTGSERKPGGFYPKGADGKIAKSYLRN